MLLLGACAGAVDSETFETTRIAVGDDSLLVLVADSSGERQQGLQDVGSIPGGADGMLFVWDEPTTASFHMGNVEFPLDVWWFDEDGHLLGSAEMSTCADSDCVSYGSPGRVMWALESVAGEYTFSPGSSLLIESD